ncbi:hypothetical protein [Sorangium sp. So ce1182]|uniref:hypothetical protein n=1 Tax=Sorangium sp. So ce1182 TaxID=3133334 RepID=UPI003F5D5D52
MIRLTRAIPVSSFDVEATVAVGRDRPEFLAVARLAADLARPIGARDVLRELLGPRPAVLGWRVIERCVDLRLLERVGEGGEAALSEIGRLALDHGEVLVPEEGIWRFFVVDDPLVPAVLIDVRRLEAEPVRKEREAAKEARARGERSPQPERSPDLLRRCCGVGPLRSVSHGPLFQLVELGDRGSSGLRGQLRLEFTWDAAPSIRLSGRLPSQDDGESAKPIDAEVDLPEVVGRWSREALWKMLVTHATRVPGAELDRWRAVAGRSVVPAAFHSLPEAARRVFRRNLDVPASDLQELGRFDPTVLKDVDVVPATQVDAQAWLSWLQWEAVNDYALPVDLERKSGELHALFPHHQPRALSASELLARARAERGDRSWFLLAPSDLGLWR